MKTIREVSEVSSPGWYQMEKSETWVQIQEEPHANGANVFTITIAPLVGPILSETGMRLFPDMIAVRKFLKENIGTGSYGLESWRIRPIQTKEEYLEKE